MEPEKDPSIARVQAQGHRRQASVKRQALLRRSTVGPLDADADPLVGSTASLSIDDDPLAVSTPSLPGAQEAQEEPSREDVASPAPEPTVTVIDRAAKNFSFLVRPENYLPLDQQDLPEQFHEEVHQQPSRKALLESLHDGHYRTAVWITRELLLACNPTDHESIFRLLYVRLAASQILGLHTHAAQESKCLQDLSLPFFRDRGRHLAPWELRVLIVRLHAIAFNDWRRAIMTYYELAREARYEARRASAAEQQLWKSRLQELGICVGNALIEINDMEGAIRHLKTLPAAGNDETAMMARLALLHLRCGDVDAAKKCFSIGDQQSRILHPLCTMAEGDFEEAARLWESVRSNTDEQSPESGVISQALAICKLYSGHIQEARDLLESLVQPHGAMRGLTLNLSTIYELSSEGSRDLKVRLADHVASQSVSGGIWDKSNADFKL